MVDAPSRTGIAARAHAQRLAMAVEEGAMGRMVGLDIGANPFSPEANDERLHGKELSELQDAWEAGWIGAVPGNKETRR